MTNTTSPLPPTERSAVDPAGVCALVPCHREAPATKLLSSIGARVGEVLVVEDGVAPDAKQRLSAAVSRGGYAMLSTGGLGKGHAVSRGIELLMARPNRPRAVLVIDGDGQHPPGSIPAFLEAARDADLVIGDRFGDLAQMPVSRRVANRAASRLLALRTGRPVRDSQCGMRLLTGRALHELPPGRGGYEAESEHLKRCLLGGVAVSWVPIPAIYDGEVSHFHPVRDSSRIARKLLG